MKSELLFAPVGNGTGNLKVPCQSGWEVRVEGVALTWSAADPQLDGVEIIYLRSNSQVLKAVSNQGIATTGEAWGALGVQHASPILGQTVVATGVTVYQPMNHINIALPDIWWPWDVIINTAGTTSAQCVCAFLLYTKRLRV